MDLQQGTCSPIHLRSLSARLPCPLSFLAYAPHEPRLAITLPRYAISTEDNVAEFKLLPIPSMPSSSMIAGLYISGVYRTEVDMRFLDSEPGGYAGNAVRLNTSYVLCLNVRNRIDWLGAKILLSDVPCIKLGTVSSAHRFEVSNPPLTFDHTDPPSVSHAVGASAVARMTLSATEAEFTYPDEPQSWIPPDTTRSPYLPNGTVLLLQALHVPCPLSVAQQMKPWVYMQYGGRYFLHDARLELLDNTIDAPHAITRSVAPLGCPNVVKNLFNREGCVVGLGCAPVRYNNQRLTLNETTLSIFYTSGSQYVYRCAYSRSKRQAPTHRIIPAPPSLDLGSVAHTRQLTTRHANPTSRLQHRRPQVRLVQPKRQRELLQKLPRRRRLQTSGCVLPLGAPGRVMHEYLLRRRA